MVNSRPFTGSNSLGPQNLGMGLLGEHVDLAFDAAGEHNETRISFFVAHHFVSVFCGKGLPCHKR